MVCFWICFFMWASRSFSWPCQCYGPEGVPFPGGLPIWGQGQLWDRSSTTFPASPCASPWTCWAIWALSWAWSLSLKCLCLLCSGVLGCACDSQATLLSSPLPPIPPRCHAQSPASLFFWTSVQLCHFLRLSPHLAVVSRNPALIPFFFMLLSKFRDRHCVGKDVVIPLKQPGFGPLQLQ